jgi:tetratricopeptide (TPR) repeat protein
MIRSQKKINTSIRQEEVASGSKDVLVSLETAKTWFERNRIKVFAGVAILAFGAIALFLWRSGAEADNETASTWLSRITNDAYNSSNFRLAIDGDNTKRVGNEPLRGLREIVTTYGSTKSGQMAKVYLANSYYYMGQFDSAMRVFEDISAKEPMVKASVDAGKATIFQEKGNKEEAAKLFMSAAGMDPVNPLNADYTLAAAKNFEELGKKDDAVKAYRKLLEDYPGTQFDDAAKRALIKMNVAL